MLFKEAAMMSSEVMALSKSKNSCKNSSEPPKNGRIFVDGIHFVRRMPRILKFQKNILSSEVKASKSKNLSKILSKNCLKMQSKFSVRRYVLHGTALCPHKETPLHESSLSWQAITNLLDFCVLRLPWPLRTSWHGKENACLLLWDSKEKQKMKIHLETFSTSFQNSIRIQQFYFGRNQS